MTPSMYVATVAWSLLAIGLIYRKQRKRHVPLMILGMAVDTCLVLYLQLTRDAVQKALAFDLGVLQQIHIACSTAALLLYLPVLLLGIRLLRSKSSDTDEKFAIIRRWHVRVALSAFVARTLGLMFMFSLWKNH